MTSSPSAGPIQANAGTAFSMHMKMETQHSPQNPTPHFLAINKISPGYEDTKTPLPLIVL